MPKEYDPATLDREILDALPVSFGLTATEVAQKVRPGASNSKWAHDANRRNMNRVRTRLSALVRDGQVVRLGGGRYVNREATRVKAWREAEAARKAKREEVRHAMEAAGLLLGEVAIDRLARQFTEQSVAGGPQEARELAEDQVEEINRNKVGFREVTLSHDQFLELARKAGLVD